MVKVVSSSSKSTPTAVVIMYGWLGSEYRQVNKYAELYAKRDCAVVMCTAPVSTILKKEEPLRARVSQSIKEAARIVREAESKNADQGNKEVVPVVLHYFSNGGTYHAEQLGKMIGQAKSKRTMKTDAITKDLILISDRLYHKGYEVLDSAPAYMDIISGFNALKACIQSTVLRLIISMILTMRFLVLRYGCLLLGKVNETDAFWNQMTASDLCARQIFIFSGTDTVTNPHKIEELIELRKERGINVKACKFRGSLHVLHMRMYPSEYDAICAEVLDTVTSVDHDSATEDTSLDSENEW